MRTRSAFFLLLGTMFTATGYGATFLISAYFRSQGSSDIVTGAILGVALIGTLTGVPLVGWFAGWLEASRLAALGALTIACGYLVFGNFADKSINVTRIAAFLIGLGWGMFYLSGPMALSERVTDADRGPWFTRFGAFQMAGICGSPALFAAAIGAGLPIRTAFLMVGVVGIIASLLLVIFGHQEVHRQSELSLRPWVRKITRIAASSAIRPIVMAGLGGCVFSGMMSFQSSLVEGTHAHASTFFAVHAVTAIVSGLVLAHRLTTMPRIPLVTILMSSFMLGVLALLGISAHPMLQIAAAVLTGLGYGLLYPVIQTWAINASDLNDRHAALTWFAASYFIGVFGFPPLGGWILVSAGKELFILILLAITFLELVVALLHEPRAMRTVLTQS